MNKTKISLMLAFVIVLVAAPLAMAKHHESIVDLAVADGRFTTLVAAVTATGLADALSGGEWTVFAPTDDAFAKLGLNAGNIAGSFTKAELTDILLYHALTTEASSSKAKTLLGDITMANGKIAGLKYFDGDLYVNDDSKVIIPDITGNNGVIHAVDTVILPPWPKTDEEEPGMGGAGAPAAGDSIVDVAVADGRFKTLVAAVVYTGLAEGLSGGEWTVFAPTDDAFAKLGLNAGNIAGAFSKADLTDILLYHALTSEVSSFKAKTLLGDVTMANGKIAGLKYFDGDLYVNDDSKVIIPDIVVGNGVIHVVDTVILPPWPKTDE